MKNLRLSYKIAISPSSLENLTTFVRDNSLTLSHSLLPMPLETFAFRVHVFAESMFFVVLIIPFIRRTVFPFKQSLPVEFTILKKPWIFTLWDCQNTLAIKFIMLKEALIKTTVWKSILTFSVFLSIEEIPFVRSSVSPDFLAFAIRHIIKPAPHVPIFLQVVDEDAFSFCNVVSDLAFIESPSLENKAPFSLGIAVTESAIVIRAVRQVEFPESMGLLIFPLAYVDDVFLVD